MTSLSCALLANCAARLAPEMLADLNQTSDGLVAVEGESTHPGVKRIVRPIVPKEPIKAGSVASSAAERNGIIPLTPEWYAAEDAEARRLKRLTNICRC
jgi:hypothetical protein